MLPGSYEAFEEGYPEERPEEIHPTGSQQLLQVCDRSDRHPCVLPLLGGLEIFTQTSGQPILNDPALYVRD